MAVSLISEIEELRNEAMAHSEEKGTPIVDLQMMFESLSGDASLTAAMARKVAIAIAKKQQLSPIDLYWMLCVMMRISDHRSPQVAASVSAWGTPQRGAPKKGEKSLLIARDVLIAIVESGACSMEEAWGRVAELRCVEPETVRKYWASWKPIFEKAHFCGCPDGPHDEHDFETSLRQAFTINKELRSDGT